MFLWNVSVPRILSSAAQLGTRSLIERFYPKWDRSSLLKPLSLIGGSLEARTSRPRDRRRRPNTSKKVPRARRFSRLRTLLMTSILTPTQNVRKLASPPPITVLTHRAPNSPVGIQSIISLGHPPPTLTFTVRVRRAPLRFGFLKRKRGPKVAPFGVPETALLVANFTPPYLFIMRPLK